MNGEKENKKELRSRIKKLLDEFSVSILEEKSKSIQSSLLTLSEYKNASIVMFYVSMQREASTFEAIEKAFSENRKVIVPFISKSQNLITPCEIKNLNDLKPGPFGILQPTKEKIQPSPCTQELDKLDLIIVPGMAFDKKGNRVGRGKGFYDKFLKLIDATIPKIALAFSCQIVEQVPTTENDIAVDKIVTEDGVIDCEE